MRLETPIGRRELTLSIGAAGLCAGGWATPGKAPQDRFFTTSDGVRLHYLEAGPANGRTLVFVPGWRMPAFIFARQIEAFSDDHRVIAFDPRAQGGSDIAVGGYEPGRRGKDLGELIEHLGWAPVVIVAWSLGVLDTLAYVAQAGDSRVAGLVLVDNSIGEEPAPVAAAGGGAKPQKRDDALAMRDFVRGMFRTNQDPAWIDRLTQASLKTPTYAAELLRAYPAPRTYWRDAVYATGRPILYVVRPHWKAQGENLVRKHRFAEMAVFEDAGHALFVDQAERFDALVADFLKRKVWP